MKRLCLLGEYKPDIDRKRFNFWDPQPAEPAVEYKQPEGNKNDFIVVSNNGDIGVQQVVEVKNIIDILKMLFDKYACKRFGCKTVITRAFVKTTENLIHISTETESNLPLNYRGKIYPPYITSRLSVKMATCRLLRLCGYTAVSYSALASLAVAIDELLRDFFDKMQSAQTVMLAKRTRIKNPFNSEDIGFYSISNHFKDGIIGESRFENEETKQLREKYNKMVEDEEDFTKNGFSVPGIMPPNAHYAKEEENYQMSLFEPKDDLRYDLFPDGILVDEPMLTLPDDFLA